MTEPETPVCGAPEPNVPDVTCEEPPGFNAGNDPENLDVHVHHGRNAAEDNFYWEDAV